MPHLYYLDIVGAEGHGDGSPGGYERMHSEQQQQQPAAQQADKEPVGRGFPGHEGAIELEGDVSADRRFYSHGRHAAEHGTAPFRLVFRVLGVPGMHFLHAATPSGAVHLVDAFSAEDLRHKGIGQYEETEDYTCV